MNGYGEVGPGNSETTQEEVNINFKPLYEVADETYTVYFINENGD